MNRVRFLALCRIAHPDQGFTDQRGNRFSVPLAGLAFLCQTFKTSGGAINTTPDCGPLLNHYIEIPLDENSPALCSPGYSY
jgi:hypothetical protein